MTGRRGRRGARIIAFGSEQLDQLRGEPAGGPIDRADPQALPAGQTQFTVIFEVAAWSLVGGLPNVFGFPSGTGEVDFIHTLKPAANFFTISFPKGTGRVASAGVGLRRFLELTRFGPEPVSFKIGMVLSKMSGQIPRPRAGEYILIFPQPDGARVEV